MTKRKKTRQKTDPADLRGTDEPFLRLMRIGGSAVLKLLGFPAEETEGYAFRSVVLKERRIEPDIEGIPAMEGTEGRVYVEFQGYADKFIRHRLISGIMHACAHDKYEARIRAGIVYTDENFRNAALPINTFGKDMGREFAKSFREIVLTDYTRAHLTETDPKLIVLAPFTVPPKKGKTGVLSEVREWREEVDRVYPEDLTKDALNVMGLLIMNRFRDITREEVVAMMNFDFMNTVAGRQVFEEGMLVKAREMIIEALTERFVIVPDEIMKRVHSVDRQKVLGGLHRLAIRSPRIEDFEKILSKTVPAPEKTPDPEQTPQEEDGEHDER